jgi:hypothetical protein
MITKIKKKFLKVKGSNWSEKKFKNEKNKNEVKHVGLA